MYIYFGLIFLTTVLKIVSGIATLYLSIIWLLRFIWVPVLISYSLLLIIGLVFVYFVIRYNGLKTKIVAIDATASKVRIDLLIQKLDINLSIVLFGAIILILQRAASLGALP